MVNDKLLGVQVQPITPHTKTCQICFFFKKENREKPGESKHISPLNVCFTFSRRPWFDLVFLSTSQKPEADESDAHTLLVEAKTLT